MQNTMQNNCAVFRSGDVLEDGKNLMEKVKKKSVQFRLLKIQGLILINKILMRLSDRLKQQAKTKERKITFTGVAQTRPDSARPQTNFSSFKITRPNFIPKKFKNNFLILNN